jgi:cyanoexosortase A
VGYADDFWVTAGIAWLTALYLVRQRRESLTATAGAAWAGAGALVVVGAVIALGASSSYQAFERLLPLAAGIGFALAAAGPRFAVPFRRELLVLALPLLNPVPRVIRGLWEYGLVDLTTWAAYVIHRAAGHAVILDGDSLRMPQGTLDVLILCSGMLGISRLWVIAGLVIALFPTTTLQKVALFAIGTAVGFAVNAARIAVLASTVMRGDDYAFEFWDDGTGSGLIAVGSMAVAGVCWWLVMRRSSIAPPGAPAPSAAH